MFSIINCRHQFRFRASFSNPNCKSRLQLQSPWLYSTWLVSSDSCRPMPRFRLNQKRTVAKATNWDQPKSPCETLETQIAHDGRCWPAVPLSITEARRRDLTPLCKLALDKYNAENQDANFVFLDIVKTTWSAVGMYYMTFQAQKDPPNCPATTFQAQVFRKRTGPHKVISCSIKT